MKNTEQKIRIGVLGAGGVARNMHLPVLVNLPNAKIEWICDKDGRSARQLADLFKIRDIFSNIEQCTDVDIVLVAIPVGYRREVMNYISRRGWHAFCEKPFALTRSEHEQYLSDARAHGTQIGVGLLRRYGPATLTARKIIETGCFGPMTGAWASEGFRTKRTGKDSGWYAGDPKVVGGGVLMETGSHLIDQLCTILNVNSFSINRCSQQKYQQLDFETRFTGSLSTGSQSDIPVVCEVSRLEDLCNGMFIQFQSLILKCGLFLEDYLELLTLDGRTVTRFQADAGAKTLGQALFLEWKDFIEQCVTGRPSYVSAETALQSTAIIERCYELSEHSDNKEISEVYNQ